MEVLNEINELFAVFGRLDANTMKRANLLKSKLYSVIQKQELKRINQLSIKDRIKYMLYETIGYLPLQYRLFDLKFCEFIYFNYDCRDVWNCYVDYTEFTSAIKRAPKDLIELDKYTNLDDKTKIEIHIKYILK